MSIDQIWLHCTALVTDCSYVHANVSKDFTGKSYVYTDKGLHSSAVDYGKKIQPMRKILGISSESVKVHISVLQSFFTTLRNDY